MRESRTDDRWWSHTSFAPAVPADAVATVVLVALAAAVLLPGSVDSVVLRTAVGLPLLLFLPGYALLAVCFPRADAGTTSRLDWGSVPESIDALRRPGLRWRDRVALSFGTSLLLLPPLALVVSALGLPFTTAAIAGTLAAWTLLATLVGVVQRLSLAPEQRFEVPAGDWIGLVDHGVSGQATGLDAALNVGLAALVVASLAGVGFAVAVPNGEASFTSAMLLAPGEDGGLVEANYPETLAEEDQRLVVRVGNHEGQASVYTVVSVLETTRSEGGTVAVDDRTELTRTTNTVGAGDSWDWSHDLPVRETPAESRLVYFVYRGTAPAEPDRESATERVSIWLGGDGATFG